MVGENFADIENIAKTAVHDLWKAATVKFSNNLFTGRQEYFLAFFLFVTVSAVYMKTRSVGSTLVSLILAGAMLGFAVLSLAYYFLIASGVLLAFVLYLIFS